MIVTRGFGKNLNYLGSMVAYGYTIKSTGIIDDAWRLIKYFVLKISQDFEVELER